MKIYNTQEEINADIKDGVLKYDGGIKITFSNCIVTGNIDAVDIDAVDINARNIDARNIDARNINARNINAGNINARNIDARNIIYYAVCVAYKTFKCLSHKSRRENGLAKCLDGEIEIKKEKHTITIDGKEVDISEESYNKLKEAIT